MKTPLLDEYGEVRELTAEDMAEFKPLAEVMPSDFVKMVLAHQAEQEKKRARGKQKAPLKQSVTIRLSADVVEKFKATGKGWQNRINQVLLQHIQTSM